MKKIVLVAHGRFGLMKVAPLFTVMKNNGLVEPVPVLVVRDGDLDEAERLAADLGLGEHLRRVPVEASSPVRETAALMLAFEPLFDELAADFVVPGGYDGAAVAATLTASRMGIPVVSIDAGLRSYDRSEPEEINRLIIDSAAALHFVSEHSGIYNLINEGFSEESILFAGNTAIDSLVALMGAANNSDILTTLQVKPRKFVTVLLGMPLQAETARNREQLFRVLEAIAESTTLLLPCVSGSDGGLQEAFGAIDGLRVVGMPGPVELLRILKESAFVLTDTEEFESELTVMNVPCLTMRLTSCRPSTLEIGTNVLVGFDEQEILERSSVILSGKPMGRSLIPEKWDGVSATRVAEVLEKAG
ncbi:MAG: UDP-N-acetyl glucosamine 2-epimerase [Chlorobiaceae bacterium]|nr:UDP-N-acetyl glucosamine 2-epimerase [Chlorobiaceae bacterium]NTW75074.1 UDP-N-acetyl glucosamine 2-epimerase [Chlorobiaceae bacterium]